MKYKLSKILDANEIVFTKKKKSEKLKNNVMELPAFVKKLPLAKS